jgi:hypothetical protein|tara:strand:- start:40 stop:780 length:741 start_codon:yes stop_codon:yes gene_type:complete
MADDLSFIPEFDIKDCNDKGIVGPFSTKYDYILKSLTGGKTYPTSVSVGDVTFDVCRPYIHYNVNVGNLRIDQNIESVVNINCLGNINASGTVTAPNFQGNINVQSWKGFDIKHPTKKNHRLRHICLEGPEAGIYIRGRLVGGDNRIILPDYWHGLIDPNTITVSLTQIGSSQDLIVDKIEWGKTIYIKSGNASAIDCYYTVHASRIDGEPLIVEYQGETPAEYPGNSDQFSISGYDYDVRGGDKK